MLAEVRAQPLMVGGRRIETDQLGYLLDPMDWTPEIAETIAALENIALGEEHWIVIRLVREHFEQRHTLPEARTLLKRMREAMDEDRATGKYLHQLFPYGYGRQVCKIAGMRMPLKVMLDV